jgi:predicted acetyltransferase
LIKIINYSEVSFELKKQLNSLIDSEFGIFEIVTETEWATPDWTVMYFENDNIASFYNIIERKVYIDGTVFRAAGINNLITPSEFRGRGFAKKVLSETEEFIFEKLSCELGLLLCADSLISFYKKLNWYVVKCPVYFRQSDGLKIWKANTMLLHRGKALNPVNIDLNGLPW